jgi:hypothetical protein
MKSNKKPEKIDSRISPETEKLLHEAGKSLDARLPDPKELTGKLGSLAADERDGFFLALLKKEGEKSLPLLESLMGQGEEIDLSIARTLGRWNSPLAADLLRRLASLGPPSPVVKAIRRSLFQLKSRGQEVRDVPEPGPSVYRPLPPQPPEGFLSSIDADGTRLVWLVRPQALQGVFAFHALISDVKGIIEFNGFESSRKKFGDYLEHFRAEVPWEIVPADPEYCLGLIIEGSWINRDKGERLPEEFLKWREVMGPPPELPVKPLIYRQLAADELKSRTDLLDRSGGLFELPSFQAWFLEEKETEKYFALLKEASESRLVLTPYQKEARLMEIYRQAVEELFDPARRARMRRRLEEMAYILWKTGKENESRLAVAAALAMESDGGIFFLHPFLRELVKRSISARAEKEEAEKKQRESELLIKP